MGCLPNRATSSRFKAFRTGAMEAFCDPGVNPNEGTEKTELLTTGPIAQCLRESLRLQAEQRERAGSSMPTLGYHYRGRLSIKI